MKIFNWVQLVKENPRFLTEGSDGQSTTDETEIRLNGRLNPMVKKPHRLCGEWFEREG